MESSRRAGFGVSIAQGLQMPKDSRVCSSGRDSPVTAPTSAQELVHSLLSPCTPVTPSMAEMQEVETEPGPLSFSNKLDCSSALEETVTGAQCC